PAPRTAVNAESHAELPNVVSTTGSPSAAMFDQVNDPLASKRPEPMAIAVGRARKISTYAANGTSPSHAQERAGRRRPAMCETPASETDAEVTGRPRPTSHR